MIKILRRWLLRVGVLVAHEPSSWNNQAVDIPSAALNQGPGAFGSQGRSQQPRTGVHRQLKGCETANGDFQGLGVFSTQCEVGLSGTFRNFQGLLSLRLIVSFHEQQLPGKICLKVDLRVFCTACEGCSLIFFSCFAGKSLTYGNCAGSSLLWQSSYLILNYEFGHDWAATAATHEIQSGTGCVCNRNPRLQNVNSVLPDFRVYKAFVFQFSRSSYAVRTLAQEKSWPLLRSDSFKSS